MSLLKHEYFGPIIENLIAKVDPTEAASLFHNRTVSAQNPPTDENDTDARMVVTVVPHDQLDTALDLRRYEDAILEQARRIRGTVNSRWRSSGLNLRFSNREEPSLSIYRSGEAVFCQPYLIEEGRVVGVRVLLPLIGTVQVAKRLAEEADLHGSLQVDVSLLGVEGTRFHTPPQRVFHETYEFDTNHVHQRWMIETEGERSDVAVQPLANILWQSSGFRECHAYNEEGQWLQWDEHFG